VGDATGASIAVSYPLGGRDAHPTAGEPALSEVEGTPALRTARLRDLLYLHNVVQVVACHHAHDVVHALLAALLVLSVVLPQAPGHRTQKPQVILAQGAKGFERGLRVTAVVVEGVRPGILIEGLNGVPLDARMSRKRKPTTSSASAR